MGTYTVVKTESGFTVTNPKGVDYFVTKKGATFVCSCLGFVYRGACRHLQLLPKVERRFPREVASQVLRDWGFTFEQIGPWVVAGSYRRGKSTVKDLDILLECSADALVALGEEMKTSPGIQVVTAGPDILRFYVPTSQGDFEIDILRVRSKVEWAPYLLYRTGSAALNISMRGLAKCLGFKLSERGVFNRETGEQTPTPTEESIFALLGMKYQTPEERG